MSALVYGGRSPIALELCAQLSRAGHQVHLVTRVVDGDIIRLGRENGCAEVHACNLEDEESSVALAESIDEQMGGLNAVAFIHRYRSDEDPLRQYAVEVLTPYSILQALHARGRNHECAVLLTTSPAARTVLSDQDFQYHASKAAIAQLVRFGAVRFAGSFMRVNGISPGSFVFKERAAGFYAANPQIVARAESAIPLSRMGVVSEIASAGVFLLEAESQYLNGQILEVDGGISCLDVAGLVR
ncbi:MAG: Glucose 1-dehydrogenase [Nitrosomonadaceae bacterium]|nr:Glucose 1-dehydrogenase [Nitrosomonadaceae bacterium]